MKSRNRLAYEAGKITQDQFDSMAAHKAYTYQNYEDVDVNRDYSDYGLVKRGYQVMVRYPYIINNPVNFVEKAIGSNFYTYDNTPDDTIMIYCNSWVWAHEESTRDDIDWPAEDIPNIYDHATIVDEDYYEAD